MTDAATDPVDLAIGARLRLRRKLLKLSQSDLAEALGVSFQQVQKYERGANRVSASMLLRCATTLQCTVGWLVGEESDSPEQARLLEVLLTPGATEVLNAYAALPGPRTRRAVLDLLRAVASESEADGQGGAVTGSAEGG